MAIASRFLLYCLIIWAPLPVGSNRPIIWVINGVVATIILALFLLSELYGPRRLLDWRLPGWILAGMTVWAAWMLIQAVPGVPLALQHPIWTALAGDLPWVGGAISVNPASTLTTVVQVVPIVFLGLVAMRLAVDRRRAILLLNVAVAATVVVALYGLLATSFGFKQVFLLDDIEYQGFLTGTFVGRNAAATYFSIGLAAAAALLVHRLETGAARTNGSGGVLAAVDGLYSGAIYLAACGVLLAAVLNTGSRGGFIASAVALLCVAAFWVRSTKIGTRSLLLSLTLVAVALGAILGAASSLLLGRLESGVGDGARLLAYLDTIDMIFARPLLGHGAGTFVDAFPLFHDRAPSGVVWNAAHNSYLQSAAELGIPVFTIVAVSIAAVVVAILRGIVRIPAFSPVAVAAIGALAAVAFHSAIDFSIQFQAIGLTIAVLVGSALGEVLANSRERTSNSKVGLIEQAAEQATAVVTLRQRETVRVPVPGFRANPAGPALTVDVADAPSIVPGNGGPIVPPSLFGAHTSPLDPTLLTDLAKTDGKRIYVFGDVHGRIDLVLQLRDAIDRDRRNAPPPNGALVIGLGDYIDRGPEPRAVIDELAKGVFDCDAVFLRGNHEQMLIDFLENPEQSGPMWFRFGALETLQSYGLDVRAAVASSASRYRRLREELAKRIDPSHLLFLQRLPTSFQTRTHFFVHAGARPGISLDNQSSEDLLWIRDGFADDDHPFEKIVVHGHTPVEKPYFGKYRINLDTQAYFTNRVSCLVLEKGSMRMLDTAVVGGAANRT